MKLGMNGMAAMALGAALAITAISQTQLDSGSQKMMKSADISFADKAAAGGMAEVELGQLALQNASNPDVKTFAQRMVDDHTKANDQLKEIASQEKVTLPASLSQKDLTLKSRLQSETGAKFDKDYMKAMVKDHEEDVKEFQRESQKGTDPGIKNFASQTLPILQSHLDMAKSTGAKLK